MTNNIYCSYNANVCVQKKTKCCIRMTVVFTAKRSSLELGLQIQLVLYTIMYACLMSNCNTTKLKVVPKRNGRNVLERFSIVLWTVERPVPLA